MKWTESATVHGNSSCKFTLPGGVNRSSMRVQHKGMNNFGWAIELHIPGTAVLYRASGDGCIDSTKARHMAMSAVSAFLQIHDGVKPDEVA